MTKKEARAWLIERHVEDALKERSVMEVWEDLEMTLTKGAELYGQRNLHMCRMGVKGLDLDLPVKRHDGHSCVRLTWDDWKEFEKLTGVMYPRLITDIED